MLTEYELLQQTIDTDLSMDEWNEFVGTVVKSSKPNKKGKEKPKVSRTGDNYYIEVITKGKIMNEKYRQIFPDKSTLYYLLRANVIRGKTKYDDLNVLDKYYRKGFLACILKQDKLMELTGLSKRQVMKYLKELESQNIIKTERIKVNAYIYRNIYILGTWQYYNNKKLERYYLDDEISR